MRTLMLAAALTATWFLIATVLLSLACWILAPALARRWQGDAPTVRARRLFLLRALPGSAAIAFALLVAAPAFLWHEPRESGETIRWWLASGALAAGLLAADALRAARAAWRETAGRVGAWIASGRPLPGAEDVLVVDDPRLGAVVAGFGRGRVLVGGRFAASLTAGELGAVVAHERAHHAGRDNFKRLTMVALPDLLRYTARGRQIARAWQEAAEEAADARVSREGAAAALDLASAIVKAARLAPPGAVDEPALASGIARSGEVAARVSRLVDGAGWPPPRVCHARRSVAAVVGTAVGAALVPSVPAIAAAVHAISELLVNGSF